MVLVTILGAMSRDPRKRVPSGSGPNLFIDSIKLGKLDRMGIVYLINEEETSEFGEGGKSLMVRRRFLLPCLQLAVREVVRKLDFLKPESLQSPAWHAPEVSATLARSSVHKSGKVDILEQKKGTLELRRYLRANMRAVSLVVGFAGH